MHGGGDVYGVIHNQRVVAAHFQGQDFARVAGELPVQNFSGRGAAGKEQAINIRMIGQGDAGFPGALHQVQHSGRQPGFKPQLGCFAGDGRRLLAGLEHHRVAGNQGRNNMPVGQVAGEVIGAKYRNHAVGLVPKYGLCARHIGTALAGTLIVGFHRNFDFAHHGRHFGQGFPEGLSGFRGDAAGHGFFMFAQQFAKAAGYGHPMLKPGP